MGENSVASKNKLYLEADMLKSLLCICGTNDVCYREPELLNELKNNSNNKLRRTCGLPDNLVSVWSDSQASREQREKPGIPESDFILALLWTVT